MSDSDFVFENCTLDPEHPLLESFQKALKEHLLDKIAKAKTEIYEIEVETGKKSEELEKLGVSCYEKQQITAQNEKDLQDVILSLETYTRSTQEEEEKLNENNKILKDLEQNLFNTEKSNRELKREIEGIDLLSRQLAQYESRIEDDITMNKTIVQNLSKSNLKLQQDKKKQDFMIYQMYTDVWKLEEEKETIKLQIENKLNDIEEKENKVAVLETTIQAFEAEHRALMSSWQKVCLDISNRNIALERLSDEMLKADDKWKVAETELANIRIEIRKELFKNSNFTALKDKANYEISQIKKELEQKLELKITLEKEMCDNQRITEESKKQIEEVKMDVRRFEFVLSRQKDKVNKIISKKTNMEETITKAWEEEISNDYTAKKLTGDWKAIKSHRRDMQIKLSEAENANRRNITEMLIQKHRNEGLARYLTQVKKEVDGLEKERQEIKTAIAKCELRYRLEIDQYKDLSLKVSKTNDGSLVTKCSLAELKIVDTEKFIDQIKTKIKSLQETWLREQNNLLAISSERQEQINKQNILKKQVLIQEQKNYRLQEKIEELQMLQTSVERNVKTLMNKVVRINEFYQKQKNKKNDLNETTFQIQTAYSIQLEESEMDLLRLESEIAEIEEDKQTISKLLLDINREGLEWEKRMMLARQAVREKKEFSDNINDRTELMRMKNTYAKLKKEQERLVKEMTMCLTFRDHIYRRSEAEQTFQKERNQQSTNKISHTRRLARLKEQLKQTNNEIKEIGKQHKIIDNEKQECLNKLDSALKTIEVKKEYIKSKAGKELDEAKIDRQLKYELLVIYQRRALLYKQIVTNQSPYVVYKKQSELETVFNKEKSINKKLTEIIDSLINVYPDFFAELTMSLNSLGVVMVALNINVGVGFCTKSGICFKTI